MQVLAAAAPSAGDPLDRLIDASLPPGVQVRASSQLLPDPLSGPLAAVDGDTDTAWVAGSTDAQPRLEVSWGHRRTVDEITVRQQDAVAASWPTRVRIQVEGDTYDRVDEEGEPIRFPATKATSVEVTITEVLPSFAIDEGGTAGVLPAGISEFEIDGVPGPLVDPGMSVRLPCGSGPPVHVDDYSTSTSVSTDLGGLMREEPLPLTLCGGSTARLDAGPGLVGVGAGSAWRPVQMVLTPADVMATEDVTPIDTEVLAWGDTRRTIGVGDRTSRTLLTIRENANAGWEAQLDGRELRSVTVDGWQQGFELPAGAATQVELTFVPDRTYRAAIASGFVFLALLVLSVLFRGRPTDLAAVRALRLRGWLVAGVFLAVCGMFLAGPAGIAVAGLVMLAHHAHARTAATPAYTWGWAVAAGALTLLAGGALAGVGRMEAGSTTHGLVQLLCVAALAIVVAAGVDRLGSAGSRDEPVNR
jgi:arabinofuranan 3-O-arabinosyltransferase